MSKKIFISYCHKQVDWVLQRLKPCLDAGGAEVLIDYDRFKAGIGAVRQMDAEQDRADASVLVLTPDYRTALIASTKCSEQSRAIQTLPTV